MTLASFRYYNSDWPIYLASAKCTKRSWKSKELDDQEYCGEDYRDRLDQLGIEQFHWNPPIKNLPPAHACDLYEWEWLSKVGGFYSDMDILYIRSLSPLHDEIKNSDVVFCKAGMDLAIGLLASSEDCPLFAAILEKALKSINPRTYQGAGTEAVYRAAGIWPVNLNRDPGVSDRAINKFRLLFPSLGICEIPDRTVYPYIWTTADRLYDRVEEFSEETVGIHWYGGLKSSQRLNGCLNHNNFHLTRCTFTEYARRVGKPSTQ
jgi:hypothetical protein